MDYLYTNEGTLAATVTVTLGDLDELIKLLDPMAKDEDHPKRYTASDLNRKFGDVRLAMLKSAADGLNYRVQDLRD
jgi:hypothetical protein